MQAQAPRRYRSMWLRLPEDDINRLRTLAELEHRTPKLQAVHLIATGLKAQALPETAPEHQR